MNNVTIIISNSCKIPSNSVKALVYGDKNSVFSIPISQIIEAKEAVIKNEDRSYPAQQLTITKWLYDKIKPDIDRLNGYYYKLIPENER